MRPSPKTLSAGSNHSRAAIRQFTHSRCTTPEFGSPQQLLSRFTNHVSSSLYPFSPSAPSRQPASLRSALRFQKLIIPRLDLLAAIVSQRNIYIHIYPRCLCAPSPSAESRIGATSTILVAIELSQVRPGNVSAFRGRPPEKLAKGPARSIFIYIYHLLHFPIS
jgi:hypothetical protein